MPDPHNLFGGSTSHKAFLLHINHATTGSVFGGEAKVPFSAKVCAAFLIVGTLYVAYCYLRLYCNW